MPFICRLTLTLLFAPAMALGYTQEGARVVLHVAPHQAKFVCQSPPVGGLPSDTPCSQTVQTGSTNTGQDVYVVVTHDTGPGLLGVSCGIDYNPAPGVGIDAFGWTECADTGQIFAGPNGTWPQAGGGMRAIWSQSGCQRTTVPGYEHEGGHAVAGAIYVVAYGADRMDITYNLAAPVPEFDVVDCVGLGSVLPPSAAGTASFATLGGTPGCNPCLEPCAEDPVCEITATEIDFGEVWPKSFTERRIGIRNLGPGAMLGTAQTEGCALIPVLPEFRVVGRSRYLLQPGEPRNFLVRFRPVLPGYYTCVLDMGPLCPDVTLTGYGIGHLPSRRTTWGAIKGGAWGDKP